jgi:hypothetical protein
MRFFSAWVLAFFCATGVSAAPARADEDAAAKAVLAKALQAMGGETKLSKLQGVTFKVKGTLDIQGIQVDLSGEWSLQGLDRARWEVEATVMNRTETATLLLVGDKAWASSGGRSREAPKEDAAMFRRALYGARLSLNPALLRDQTKLKLSPLGELKIGERETVGLKVAQKGFPDIDLFFDKKTGLPYKSEIRQKEGKDGMEVAHAFVFGDYKEFGGIKQFTRVKFLRDDKALLDLECSEIKPQEKLDDSLFARPAKTP